MPITEEVRNNLLIVAKNMRKVAEPVGPLHGLWDTIFDYEALAAGKETFLAPEKVLEMLGADYAYYGRS